MKGGTYFVKELFHLLGISLQQDLLFHDKKRVGTLLSNYLTFDNHHERVTTSCQSTKLLFKLASALAFM